MIASLALVLVVLGLVVAGIKAGPFGALAFLVIWTAGVVVAARLVQDLGRPRTGDLLPTITEDNDFDFALVAIWPLGIPVIVGFAIYKKMKR